MTREEEINNASYAYWINNYANIEFIDEEEKELHSQDIQDSFINGAEWADAHPHWIRVEDELPKGFAIITNGDDVLIGKYNFEKGLWGVRNKTMFAYTLLPANWNVTHWMPLPQAPSSPEFTNNCEKGGEE